MPPCSHFILCIHFYTDARIWALLLRVCVCRDESEIESHDWPHWKVGWESCAHKVEPWLHVQSFWKVSGSICSLRLRKMGWFWLVILANNCFSGIRAPTCYCLGTFNISKLVLCVFHLVSPSWTWKKEMATHSSVLAWRIPGTGEPGGLPSMGSHRVGHDWSNLAAAEAAEHDPTKGLYPWLSQSLKWVPWLKSSAPVRTTTV